MTQKGNTATYIIVFTLFILFILILVFSLASNPKKSTKINPWGLTSLLGLQPGDNSFKSPAIMFNYSAQKTIETPAVNVPPIVVPATSYTYTFNVEIKDPLFLIISITKTDNINGGTTTVSECSNRPYTLYVERTKTEFYYVIDITPPDIMWPLQNCKPFQYCGSANSTECYDYKLIYRPKQDTITLRYTGGQPWPPVDNPLAGDYPLRRSEALIPIATLSSNIPNNPFAETCSLILYNNSTLTISLELQQTNPNPTPVGSGETWGYTQRDLVYVCRHVPYTVGVGGVLEIDYDLKNNSLLQGIDLILGDVTKINDTSYKIEFEYSGTGPTYGPFIVTDTAPPTISYTKHINVPNKPEYWKQGIDWKRLGCQLNPPNDNCPSFDDGFGGNFPNQIHERAKGCDSTTCGLTGNFNLCSRDAGVACRLGMSTTLPYSTVQKIGETVYSTDRTNYHYNSESNCDLNTPDMTCTWALPDPITTQSIPTEIIDALRLYDGSVESSDGQYSSYMTDYCFAKVTEGCPTGQDICPRYFQEEMENTKAPRQVCDEWREKYPDTWNTNVTTFCTTTSNNNYLLDACGCNGATTPGSKWYDVRQALEYVPGKGDQCWFGPCREQETQLLTTTQLDTSGCGELSCANITVIANSTVTDSEIKQATSCTCTVDPAVGGACNSEPGPGPGPGPDPGPNPDDNKTSNTAKWVWITLGSLTGLGLLIWLIWYLVKRAKAKKLSTTNPSM